MQKLFFIFVLLLNLSCSTSDTSESESNNEKPLPKTHNGKVKFLISGVSYEGEILSIFHHTGLNVDVIEFTTPNDKTGFYGYIYFPDLKLKSKKWELLGHSGTGFIYSKFTGFDPDFEVRYYGVSDSGESKIISVSNDSISGEFFGKLKASKLFPGFPEKIDIEKGTFQVRNSVDTVAFALGFF